MSLLERAWKGFIWGQTGRVSEALLGFIYTLIISRTLGPEQYGIYSLFISWLGVILLLSSFGFNESLGKFIPSLIEKNKWDSVVRLYKKFLNYRVLSIVIISSLAVAGRNLIFPIIGHLSIWICLMAFFRGINELYNYVFSALLEVKSNTIIRFISQISSLSLVIFFLWRFRLSLEMVLMAATISSAIGFLLYTLTLYKHKFPAQAPVGTGEEEEFSSVQILKFSSVIWLTNIVTFGLGSQIAQILISYLLKDKTAIGYYSIATLIPTTVYALLITGWGVTVLPVLSSAYSKYQNIGLSNSWNAYFKIMLILLLPISFFVLGYSDEIITLFLGAQYKPAVKLLQLFLGLNIISYLSAPGICTFSLYTIMQQKKVLRIRIISAILNLALNFLLIPVYGTAGALFATGLSICTAFFLEFFYLRLSVRLVYPVKMMLQTVFAAIIALAISRLIPAKNVVTLAINSCLFLLMLTGCFYFLKPLSNTEFEIVQRLNTNLAKFAKLFLKQ